MEISREDQLQSLYRQYAEAKEAETMATAVRRSLGEKIIALLPQPQGQDHGTVSAKLACGRIAVTYSMSYKVDPETIEAIAALPGDVYDSCIDMRYEVKGAAVRDLKESNPDLYVQLAQFITAKPASPQIKLT